MSVVNSKIELLSPAGDFERLQAAIRFSADAVYLGGTAFGMRVASARFDFDTLQQAVEYAHARGVRVYLTCNTLPRNSELEALPDFLRNAQTCNVDALIVTDIGVLDIVKRVIPDMEVHISTQAGIVNYAAADMFYRMGAQRVVLARELTLDEIAQIRDKTPPQLEIEAFVHGAMCMSFSGRCMLSSYLTGRDANRGACAQPCRWRYHLMEEKREGEFHPIFEDEEGTYILNAKDLCMIEYLDQVIGAGVTSLKIEGRAKSAYYVSVVTNAYRMALDLYQREPHHYILPQWLKQEVTKVSHRRYCTGFYFGQPQEGQYYETGGYLRSFDVVGIVEEWKEGYLYLTQRNKFSVGDEVEFLSPGRQPVQMTITGMQDGSGNPIQSAPHPTMQVRIPSDLTFPCGTIVRMALQDGQGLSR